MAGSTIMWRTCGKPMGESAEANRRGHSIICVLRVGNPYTTSIKQMNQMKLKVIK